MTKYTFLKSSKTKDCVKLLAYPITVFKFDICWGMAGFTSEKITPTRTDEKE